jgi:hypothetical protein
MKTIFKGFIAAITCLPLLAFSADSTETYTYALSKLRANPDNYNWLQERSTEGVDFASMVLCLIKATGADLGTQINKGPYLASVTKNGCEKNKTPSSSATDGANTGIQYEFFVINSTSDGTNLDVKLWVPYNKDVDTDSQKKEIRARFIFPLNRLGSDIGFSEMYFKGLTTDEAGNVTSSKPMMYGFMKPETVANGYKLIYAERANWGSGEVENWLNLNRTGTGTDVTLTGWTQNAIWSNSDGKDMPATFVVAANQNEILRQQTFKGVTTAPICFNRNSSKFNTWNYNLYDASTGLLVGANSNYQIHYGDYRGNYGSNNFWLPDAALQEIYSKSGKTADITLEDGASTKNATVTVSNGGLWKVKKTESKISELADMTFTTWITNTESRIYWDKTAQKFKNEADGSLLTLPTWDTIWLNGSGVSYVVRAPKTSVTDNNGWTSSQVNWAGLTNDSKVVYRQETRVSETELLSINGKTLNCVANCPFWKTDAPNSTSTQIYNQSAWDVTKAVNNKTFNGNSNYEAGKAYQYTYNHVQRKLFNTDTAYAASAIEIGGDLRTNWKSTDNAKNINTGALVLDQDHPLLTDVIPNSRCSWDNSGNQRYVCGWDYENSLTEYYYWRSGEYQWDKQWTVKIDGVPPTLSDPINVKYTCPAGRTDCAPGSKLVLNYNGPGQLWGIPNRCVSADDYTVTVDCNDNTINKQWLNKFNLTTSPVNADKTTDKVVKVSDASKEYWILPQGSGEWYNKKGAGTAADCSVTLPTGTAQPINVDTYYKPTMTDIGNPPINFRTTPVSIQNGVKLR